jgi:glycosyltransferase involved in cell wall biosynthesis
MTLRIGLVAAACHPDRGSESGTGWAWLCGLAQLGQHVELVTRADGAANRRTAEAFGQLRLPGTMRLRALPGRPVLPLLARALPVDMREEWWSLSNYLGWLSEVDELVAAGGLSDVDLIHHVSLGSLNSGSLLGDLGRPLIFGPVGGGQRCPLRLRPLLGRAGYGEMLRDAGWAANRRFGPRFAATMRRADAVLATNRDTASIAARHGARRVELMLQAAVREESVLSAPPPRGLAQPLLLWVGSLRPRKAPGLALRAFRYVLDDFPAALLQIVGDGPLRAELKGLARRLGVAGRVEFTGAIPHADVRARYSAATLLLFTSVRDSFGAQALDAWASGLPTVSFAHHGIGDFSPSTGSVLVGACTAAAAPRRFAAAAAAVLGAPEQYPQRCATALAHARRHTVQARTRRTVEIYTGLLGDAAARGGRSDASR